MRRKGKSGVNKKLYIAILFDCLMKRKEGTLIESYIISYLTPQY